MTSPDVFKITLVAGARPNFIKISPILKAIIKAQENNYPIEYRLVHTGQHYDQKMSQTFFEELQISQPDINLNCGGGSQAEQTAAILLAFEKELIENPTNLVLVVGDVTSTMACAITAKKLNIDVAHVEAGIRSFDRKMPEEINRIITDSITDLFFTTTKTADQHLIKSGIDPNKIYRVGNVMIDTLYQNLNALKKPFLFEEKNLETAKYYVLTLHRPANVDEENKLKEYFEVLLNTVDSPVIFPMHPRTQKIFNRLNIKHEKLIITDPMGYLEFIYLIKNAKAVITDSGGITEECSALNIPCFTLRDSTERPETVDIGTNKLLGTNPKVLEKELIHLQKGNKKNGQLPPLWDGNAAERIIASILSKYQLQKPIRQ